MGKKSKTEEINELKKEVEKTKPELEVARHGVDSPSTNSQDKFIETLFDKGGVIFERWLQTTSENEKFSIEKQNEIEKEEMQVAQVLDSRDKVYKAIIITVCILAMSILAYFEKAQSVAPVIGVIIGLVLKSSSITEFFGGGGKNKNADIDN